ncbi:unnamed protein product [Medioppia subpectinata]|uniref:C2H2-type domain-containing protein n=1 Tax=Medioppia subpectinata TaxID=1979941 RepID=A0A7R9L3I4_9ACAR|nr:unnamed protein product [Medioppia subpectinata]CAG2114885.1 unnamed protein product [Medioppia subpectinata]
MSDRLVSAKTSATITARDDDSRALTHLYEWIDESFVRQKSVKCHYDGCDKGFATQNQLDLYIRQRHAIDGSAQFGEQHSALDYIQHIPPINTTGHSVYQTIFKNTTTSSPGSQWVDNTLHNLITSCDAGDQFRSRAPDGRQQMPTITATNPPPQLPIITTSTSRPDRQSLDITLKNDSDSDIEFICRVPAPKRSARNRSPSDVKPKSLAPDINEKLPDGYIKLTTTRNEPKQDTAAGIQVDRRRESPSNVGPRSPAYGFRCPFTGCGDWFQYCRQLKEHTKRCDRRPDCWQPVVTPPVRECQRCGLTFANVGLFHAHKNRCRRGLSGIKRYFSDNTTTTTTTNTTATTRARDGYLCPHDGCDKTFETRRLFRKHSKSHRKCDKPREASPSPSVNAYPLADALPVTTHSSIGYLCPYVGCHRGFTDQLLFYGHIQSVHIMSELYEPSATAHPADRHQCSRCGNTFVSVRDLQDHQMFAHR